LTQQENKSIHYEEYPVANEKLINKELESSVQLAKDIIKSVRNLRVKLKLPNKQPLNSITIVSDDNLIPKQIEIIEDLIKNEVNVKNIIIDPKVDDWIQYDLKPNFQMLGPKLGKDINKVVNYLSNLDDSEKRALLKQSNFLIENLDIKVSEIDIKLSSKSDSENFEIVEKFGIILDTEISEDLKKERLSREIVSIIQQKRKSDGYEITDRVKVEVISDEEIIKSSISDFNEYIKNETLATDLVFISKVGDEKVLDYNFSVELQNSTNKS
jgi:isoleucyl-tRNA synthetase